MYKNIKKYGVANIHVSNIGIKKLTRTPSARTLSDVHKLKYSGKTLPILPVSLNT